MLALTLEIQANISKLKVKYGFIVDQIVLINYIVCQFIVFKVLGAYCSVVYIINIICIVSSLSQHTSEMLLRRQRFKKSKSELQHFAFVYTLNVYFRLLTFQSL